MKGCTLAGLCRACAITPQAYHKGLKARRRRHVEEDLVLELARKVRASHPRMGTRKLLAEISAALEEAGAPIGRDRLFGLLGERGMLVSPKRRRARTTFSDHSLPLYRNLVSDLEPTAPHQLLVADITYVDTDEGFLYLSLVTDRFSRKIVGHHAADTLGAAESVKALAMAIAQLPGDRFPIHHSDRGSQYCCREYVGHLGRRGLSVSMTEQNHCYENCYAERVNGTLKNEYNLDLRFRTKAQARLAIGQAILMYNNFRPHASLGMRTPSQVHEEAA